MGRPSKGPRLATGVDLIVGAQHLITLLQCNLGHTLDECQRLRAAKCLEIGGIVIEPRQAGFGVVDRGRRLCRRCLAGDVAPLHGVDQKQRLDIE